MLFTSKRTRIIKKAIAKTVAQFITRTPAIYEHYFYGAYNISPENLVIWFIFETNEDLKCAKQTDLCKEIESAAIQHLLSLGYPKTAFEPIRRDIPIDKINIQGCSDKMQDTILRSITHRTASIAFTSKENIKEKANGSYYLYFK